MPLMRMCMPGLSHRQPRPYRADPVRAVRAVRAPMRADHSPLPVKLRAPLSAAYNRRLTLVRVRPC